MARQSDRFGALMFGLSLGSVIDVRSDKGTDFLHLTGGLFEGLFILLKLPRLPLHQAAVVFAALLVLFGLGGLFDRGLRISYPVFDVIPHITLFSAYECPELFFRKSPHPDFGNSSIVMTALRRNSGYFALMR